MDDYILDLLRLQGEPEGEAARELVVDLPAGIPGETDAAGLHRQNLREAVSDKAEQAGRKIVDERRDTLWQMAEKMNSAMTVPAQFREESAPKAYGSQRVSFFSARHTVENESVSPEGLSMFFQRDARRYS